MKILTFDIEDWFHILDYAETKSPSSWSNFESRIHIGMAEIFQILEKLNISATFFIVGWIAEKYPEIINEIINRGYEIGSHTHYHQIAHTQNFKTFYRDVEKSIKTLEDLSGKKIRCFRAPGFSITEKNKWAIEVLHKLGIKIDCSIFPASRAHGGFPKYKLAVPSIIDYNGITIKEFPINCYKFFGNSMVFSGGGYFRLMPYYIIKDLTLRSKYVMSYFHPRDFDYKQPVLKNLSYYRRFKSYVGLKECKPKLEKWLSDFDFVDLNIAEKNINWKKAPIIEL